MALKHQADPARKWRAAIRDVQRHFPERLPACLFLTDPERTPDPLASVTKLPPGSGLIYRHFGADNRHIVAEQLAAVSRHHGVIFLIAADPALALSVGADGVHWPEARIQQARAWRGKFVLQTASAHSRRAVWRAQCALLDAVLISAVFPSQSKSAGHPLGVARFRNLISSSQLPAYALGGVNAHTAMRISNVAGLSGVSAFS